MTTPTNIEALRDQLRSPSWRRKRGTLFVSDAYEDAAAELDKLIQESCDVALSDCKEAGGYSEPGTCGTHAWVSRESEPRHGKFNQPTGGSDSE